MPSIDNELLIRATPEKVWAVLTDTGRYWEWSPRLLRVDGTFAPGAVVTLHYKKERAWMPERFVVDVNACTPREELSWSGPQGGAKGFLRATRTFRLRDRSEGTKVNHSEVFAGALAGLLWPLLGPAVAANHAAVNAALRARCEAA